MVVRRRSPALQTHRQSEERMRTLFYRWLRRYFSAPQGVILIVLLVVGFGAVIFLGDMLARVAAVARVFSIFLASLLLLLFGLVPLISAQATTLLHNLPDMIAGGQQMLMQLPERYPAFVTQEQIADLMVSLRSNVTALGHNLVSLSLNTLAGVFTVVLYVVLLPMLVFFLLKDKRLIQSLKHI